MFTVDIILYVHVPFEKVLTSDILIVQVLIYFCNRVGQKTERSVVVQEKRRKAKQVMYTFGLVTMWANG